jgi:hypothetical protein
VHRELAELGGQLRARDPLHQPLARHPVGDEVLHGDHEQAMPLREAAQLG